MVPGGILCTILGVRSEPHLISIHLATTSEWLQETSVQKVPTYLYSWPTLNCTQFELRADSSKKDRAFGNAVSQHFFLRINLILLCRWCCCLICGFIFNYRISSYINTAVEYIGHSSEIRGLRSTKWSSESKFWSVSLEHFIERKPLISEEWGR